MESDFVLYLHGLFVCFHEARVKIICTSNEVSIKRAHVCVHKLQVLYLTESNFRQIPNVKETIGHRNLRALTICVKKTFFSFICSDGTRNCSGCE